MRSSLVASLLAAQLLAIGGSAGAAVVIVKKGGPIDTIQAGVDAANAGDTVKVKKGVYQENVTIPSSKAGITLIGLGRVIIEARAAGGLDAGPGILVDADGATIRNFVIRNAGFAVVEGDGIQVTADDVTVDRCTGITCADTSFRVIGANRARFLGCRSLGSPTGFALEISQGHLVANCTISGATSEAIEANDVIDCAMRRCAIVGCAEGVHLQGTALDGFVVDRCRFETIAGFAISAAGSHVTLRRCRIRGADGGISFGDTGNVALVVRDNRIEQVIGSDALAVADVDGVEIRNNVLIGGQLQGITVDQCPNLTLEGNAVLDAGGRFPARSAIDVDACPGAVISGNRADDVVGPAFELAGADVTLDGNRATNCVGDGFFIRPGTTNLEMLDCLARRCSAEGLDHRGANSSIHDNAFKKCRLDLTNDGTATFTNNQFKTGGEASPHEID